MYPCSCIAGFVDEVDVRVSYHSQEVKLDGTYTTTYTTLQTLLQGRGDSDDLDRHVSNLKVVLIVYIACHFLTNTLQGSVIETINDLLEELELR